MFGTEGDIVSTIVWFVFFIIVAFLGPRMMVTQSIMALERDVAELEIMTEDSIRYISKKIKADREQRKKIARFMEFFSVMPVQTDPYGLMKKIDHVVKMSDRKLDYFAEQINPKASRTEKMNLKNGLAGAMTNHQIAKAIRHWLELIKKYKMFQFAMIIQMQIPLIKRMAKAANNATKAFMDEIPIGDSIGPLIAADMMKGKTVVYKDEEFAVSKIKMKNKTLFVSKAEGPGATIGSPGGFVTKFMKKNKINRIITVDAGLKMEGERAGSIAEGVGIAMGPGGADKYQIEEIVVRKNLPFDAIVVKESEIDALSQMSDDILNAVPKAKEALNEAIFINNKKESILIIGVGNTCGVGNTNKDVEKSRKIIRDYNKKTAEREKKKGWFS